MSMEVFDKSQLVDAIRKGEINFIGSCLTPWHAIGIDCAISYLQAKGVEVKGVICLCYTMKESEMTCILNQSHFVNQCCRYYIASNSMDYTISSILRDLVDLYRSTSWYNGQTFGPSQPTLYIASVWHPHHTLFRYYYPLLKENFSIQLMVVDEGLATYFQCNKGYFKILKNHRTSKTGLARVLSQILRMTSQKLVQRFEENTHWTNLNLLKRDAQGQLYPNLDIMEHYRKTLTTHASRLSADAAMPDLTNAVVICTMAYLRDSIQGLTDVETVSKAVQAAKAQGLKVYLKPHPREVDYRERYASLDCEILTANCSMEVLMARNPKIQALVSFSSTSLVTANLIFGIKAISLIGMVEMEKYGEYIQGEMNSFCECFASMVEMPRSQDELSQCFSSGKEG